MLNLRIVLVIFFAVISMGSVRAAYILDTGPGASGSTMISLANQGVSYQNLGVTFNIAQASSITSVEGWIGASQTGNVLFELHQGSSPNGSLLFSSLVTISNTADGWRGATGLDWDVQVGDYTLALIAQPSFIGWMAISPPSPAGAEWFENPLSGGWTNTIFNMGWRVGAEASNVPEPGSLALLGLGLAGLAATRRRKQ